VTNLAPENGTYLTPPFADVHNGSFNMFDTGNKASEAIERIAEDGTSGTLTDAFNDASGTQTAATLANSAGIPPVGPGETASMTFDLDGSQA
jgi:hypothetical protein